MKVVVFDIQQPTLIIQKTQEDKNGFARLRIQQLASKFKVYGGHKKSKASGFKPLNFTNVLYQFVLLKPKCELEMAHLDSEASSLNFLFKLNMKYSGKEKQFRNALIKFM